MVGQHSYLALLPSRVADGGAGKLLGSDVYGNQARPEGDGDRARDLSEIAVRKRTGWRDGGIGRACGAGPETREFQQSQRIERRHVWQGQLDHAHVAKTHG